MLNIPELQRVFSLNDPSSIRIVHNNIITKFLMIESCRNYFDPKKGFHCSDAPSMQPEINILALVTCAKAISDDLAEIIRILFETEINSRLKKPLQPWHLKYYMLSTHFQDKPLETIVNKYGMNRPHEANTFFAKIKRLRDVLIHRDIEDTYNLGSARFTVSENYTAKGDRIEAVKYAGETQELMKEIAAKMNHCLLTHGKNSLID